MDEVGRKMSAGTAEVVEVAEVAEVAEVGLGGATETDMMGFGVGAGV